MLIKKWFTGEKINLPLFLPLFYFCSILSIFFIKKTNMFFSVDPEAQFYSNALLLLMGKNTIFVDHPGTLFQISLAFIFIPFRINYLLFHSTSSYVAWWLQNAELVWGVYRVFNVFLYFIGFWLLLQSSFLISKSRLVVFNAFLAIISINFFSIGNWVLRFGSDSLNFFLFGLWTFVAINICLKRIDKRLIWLMPIIAGLGLANKMITAVIPVVTLVFFFLTYFKRDKTTVFVTKLFKMSVLIFFSFIAGVLPGLYRYRHFLNYWYGILTHEGLHGSGQFALFFNESYWKSIKKLYMLDRQIFIFAGLIPVIYLLLRFFYPKIEKRIRNIYFSFLIGSTIFFLIAAKFPEVHYQYINYSIFAYLFALSGLLIQPALRKYIFFVTFLIFINITLVQFSRSAYDFDVGNRSQVFMDNYKDKEKITIWTYTSPSKE